MQQLEKKITTSRRQSITAEVFQSYTSKASSRAGSDISSVRIPIERESNIERIPSNLSELLKELTLQRDNVLASREDLMDVRLFENDSSNVDLICNNNDPNIPGIGDFIYLL
ncbi:hypothetical protein BC833DRAFT_601608 [Globomyces pollinis-pini]|nr:hypothetical protein BC833DRAFT_601608 [Globomyces pollinis-pini]